MYQFGAVIVEAARLQNVPEHGRVFGIVPVKFVLKELFPGGYERPLDEREIIFRMGVGQAKGNGVVRLTEEQ